MLSTSCRGVGAAGAEPAAERASNGHRGAELGQDRRQGSGVQHWSDGSRYEGEFVNGFKHGTGRYTWRNGEYYEGSFYKDYRHGNGIYCWPTGHRFTGKFYLNRKEGYGQQLFPDGTIFQGLYHADQRFGPGVVTYPGGCQDVGLWLGERMIRLCTSVEEGFSLRNFPEYAAYMDTAATTDSLTLSQQSAIPSGGFQKKSRTPSEVLSDEDFILPPGMESYSTDGDHLPLPPGRRRELDQHFYGELWEPNAYLHQGYERDPLSTLPLQARMQTHIHKHRLQAENVGWDVAAVLSLSREGFGSKGPLEVTSELLIQHASRGELQAVSQILQTGLVHPDIADAQGHTALIAATVNCHNNVIQLLLDMGTDIDMLNCEGMSALAVCLVLYYPFQSLHTTLSEPAAEAQVLKSACGNSLQNGLVWNTADTPGLNSRAQTSNTTLSHQSKQSSLSDSRKVSNDGEFITEQWVDQNEAGAPKDSLHLREEEGEKYSREDESEGELGEREEGSQKEEEGENKGEKIKVMEEHDQTWPNREDEVKDQERPADSRNEDGKLRGEVEEDVDERIGNIQEEDVEEREEKGNEDVPGVERSIQVLDGHIALGSVQWKERRSIGRLQGKDRELTQNQNFDSARSVSSYKIQVTEEVLQRSAEALSRTGIPQRSDTQETVRKMAVMKIEHRVRLNTLRLLLERGADPNLSRVPMPVLFLAVMAADTEVVRQLLLCGARTDIPLPPERKGLYPLHVAASLPGPAGPTITELLLHAITDPDSQAWDQDEVYEPDNIIFNKPQEPLSTNENPNLKGGGRTALHVACQRESDYRNASKVVALLLSHRARTDLLWSGHSPLSLAIASGNDLAVEELLKGGADPNIPLGSRVGSALCALANISYHLGGTRTKLLDMLAKAGADILMPVIVGDVVGTAVDYAHYSFSQDLRIANTPFHALNMREREIFKTRRQLLTMMGDLLRKTVSQRETEYLEREEEHLKSNAISLDGSSQPHETEKRRKPVFKFCYHCGRSVSVKLAACSRCHKVYYCSRACTLKAWEERHKEECIRVSASANGIQKNIVFKSQKGPSSKNIMLKSKTIPRPLSVKLKSPRAPKPLRMAEKVSESQLNLKENYSLN
ncbi:ankyrin repeat and MYND domain-containing protein 1 isoform X1 [Anabas testudineus]|uniref:MYND-type domain-containing protein n=1 Tax=Anabas testudineus TaxID=64144 RepID=A0AAQ6IH86_ANATE|nr:ankyrin repeat and MYND domain-containing protein 1 isoform X1 [Anabas testudineus]